jgi:excisionase family DNA binding protein
VTDVSRIAGAGRPKSNAEARPEQRPTPSRRLVSLAEAAEVLGLSVASIRRLVRAGTLPAVRLTRRLRIDVRDLDRLVEQAKDRTA